MFQDYEISFSEKKISDFQMHCHELESRYRNEIPKAETPLCMLSEKADSPCSDRMANWQGAGAWVSHCDTRVPIGAINFLSQTIFQLFFMSSSCSRTMR